MSPLQKVLLFSLLVIFRNDASAQFTQQQVNAFRQSVVRVDATGCKGVIGGNLAGSGFFWKQNTQIVTALHVVNGCSGLSVYSDIAGDSSPARVTKVLVASDLVLLTLSKAIDGTVALVKSKGAPLDTQEMLVVGFPGDSSGSTGKTVKRQFSGDTLKTIVSYKASEELKQTQSPALDTIVVFLQGTLEHGHSGSPIFNHTGDVVGVADGGLKHGTTEDSWAIPSQHLAILEVSTEPLPTMAKQKSSLLFAAGPVSSAGPQIQCGGGSFKHLKTVRYSDVLLTADDPKGLQQLADVKAFQPLATAALLDPATFNFEVYQDSQTGATIVLPEAETLSTDGSTCVATSSAGGVTTRARIADVTTDPTYYSAALAFETEIMGLNKPGWGFAQAFSYPQPLPIVGGGFALRKDWVHYLPYSNFQQFDAQQFETLAGRGKVLLGVTAQNTRWTPLVVQTQQSCLVNPKVSQYCRLALQDLKDWVQSLLAVHLSTLAGT